MYKYIITGIGILVLAGCASLKKDAKPLENTGITSSDVRFFKGEIRPEQSKACFEGAYYRKLVSSEDNWVGIEGKVLLPQIEFDKTRINPKKSKQYLDNPSVYLGGCMDGQETDIGLSWEVIKDERGVVSEERKAFRPFMRRTGHGTEQAAVFVNAPAIKDYYWYPGEEVHMSVVLIRDGLLRFVIEGAGKKFEYDFECAGYAFGRKGEFKRVNAIDQMSNEGKPAQATTTKVKGSRWSYTNLIRHEKGVLVAVPFHEERYTEMACPKAEYFDIVSAKDWTAKGGEEISISGAAY